MVAAQGGQLGQRIVSGRAPGQAPARFIECVERVAEAVLGLQSHSQVVKGLTVPRRSVISGEPFEGLAEMGFGFCKPGLPELANAQHRVDPRVTSVPAQRLFPIGFRALGWIMELLEALARQAEFFDGLQVFRSGRVGEGLGHRRWGQPHGRIGHQHLALGGE